jgi:hypothetical protein
MTAGKVNFMVFLLFSCRVVESIKGEQEHHEARQRETADAE